ncbi:hypothetical protein GGR28_000820 [Lewinella aquimaris]|uniref:Membrane or secreted protein n=1 Tax=Neolewinella aquimaris TaxID=1835722 RepID=A0A840E8T8_9BACT|nr:hypothetical protein [Neolewinella aquimaris]MBB4078219.1 hypothetical protein [Neolewinella aquimaris]
MKLILFLLLVSPVFLTAQTSEEALQGAWESSFLDENGTTNTLSMIIEEGYFSMTAYNKEEKNFIATLGGKYEVADDSFNVTYEFDSSTPDNVGKTVAMPFVVDGSLLVFNGDKAWQRLDDGSGPLAGAWEITGRKQDGEIRKRDTSGPRHTMKILSGTRFQWIAFNTETAEFMGTGGGSYTSEGDKYVERIEFFSRDPERVGAELGFDYKVVDDEWHHSGLSSKGDPIYETWGHR